MNELAHTALTETTDPSENAPRPVMLALETAAVTVGTLAVIRLLHAYPSGSVRWLTIPCALVAAALLPAWIGHRDFPRIGLHAEPIRRAVKTVLWVSACIFPPVGVGLWLLASSGLPIPLRTAPAVPQGWLAWLLYQFLYVAVSEEVFFRGYVQANVTRVLAMRRASCTALDARRTTQDGIAIVVSAACFALAHVLVQGQIASILTFLPGLLMAWLFVRMQSLLAPILFHGLANVSYGIMAMAFA
jgi:membrane protease YdiL (CAAX protease family)